MKILIIVDIRKRVIKNEDDFNKIEKSFECPISMIKESGSTKTALNRINTLLATEEQLQTIASFPGGTIRYSRGKKWGFNRDILCMDTARGSYYIVDIKDLINRI